jgi:ribosomal protein S21
LQVLVRDNNLDQALRFLKKKLQQEGVFREMRLREHYEKPSRTRTWNNCPEEGEAGHPSETCRLISGEMSS